MSKFVENVNEYMAGNKIKQSFVALKTGMNVNKVSRILNQTQNATEVDMEAVSMALGHSIDFFLSSDFKMNDTAPDCEQISFYSGNVNDINRETVEDCINLLENIHSITGREEGLFHHINEVLYAGK